MLQVIKAGILAGMLPVCFTAGTSPAQTAKLDIQVTNIQPGKGNVVIGVYNTEESWFKKPFVGKTIKADQASMTVSFEVPEGTYGIAIFQDLDSNGELKYGLFNIPKEPVALGNNFKPKFSAPKFSDCAIVAKGNTAIALKLY